MTLTQFINQNTIISFLLTCGFSNSYMYRPTSHVYGMGKDPIHLNYLDCPESATDINKCSYNVNHSCTHYNDASVVCCKFCITLSIYFFHNCP